MFFHFLVKQAAIDLKTIGGFRLFLRDAEEFGQKVRRELADFVEKNGTAFGHFEAAGLASDGSGEGSALVAKTMAPPRTEPARGTAARGEKRDPRIPAGLPSLNKTLRMGPFTVQSSGIETRSKKGAQKPPRSKEEVWRGGTSK